MVGQPDFLPDAATIKKMMLFHIAHITQQTFVIGQFPIMEFISLVKTSMAISQQISAFT